MMVMMTSKETAYGKIILTAGKIQSFPRRQKYQGPMTKLYESDRMKYLTFKLTNLRLEMNLISEFPLLRIYI